MKFLAVTDKDIPLLYKYLNKSIPICDFSVGTFFMWRDFYNFEICEEQDVLYVKGVLLGGQTAFMPPFCVDYKDFCPALRKVIGYCMENRLEPLFSPVPEAMLPGFCNHIVTQEKIEHWSDYIYDGQALRTLSGKKYHGKKNHVNKFRSTYSFKFEKISSENVADIIEFLQAVPIENGESAEYEHQITKEVLLKWELLQLLGGVLYVEGEVIGFTIGEIVGNTLIVHTEKANKMFSGSHEMLAYLFVNEYPTEFVNREEDLGEEGMRASKLSYNPVNMLDKYTVLVENI